MNFDKTFLTIVLLTGFLPAIAFSDTKIDSLLSCKIFANGMPQGELEMPIKGETENQVSKDIKTDSGKFSAKISWGGFFEGVPRNPEIRIQYLNSVGDKILVESYKNVDLQRIEKSDICCEVDNVGLRTADDVVYLSCTYQKK